MYYAHPDGKDFVAISDGMVSLPDRLKSGVVWDPDDDDTIELITTSELLRRLEINAAMRAELTASHGPILDRLWSRDELAALTKME